MMRKHGHVVDHVDDFLHGLLSVEDARYVREHSEACPICRTAMDEARQRLVAMEQEGPAEVSPELIRQTMERIEETARRNRRRKRIVLWSGLGAVAAGFLLYFGLSLYFSVLSPTPYDLRVYGQRELFADTSGSLRVFMYNRRTGSGMKGVPVNIELVNNETREGFRLASFETNAAGSGSPQFRLPDWKDGSYTLRVAARPGWSREEIVRNVKLKRAWKLMLTTDRPVYQPGQTILVRNLALRLPDLKPVAGRDVVYSIADPKGNVIFKNRTVTSRFGISSAECPLADEILEGSYAITCDVGGTTSKATVEVKKYVLPKFKINITLDKPYYEPGERVRGEVQADYFFGKPVAHGRVMIEATGADVRTVNVGRVETTTDSRGHGVFELRLPEYLAGRTQDSGDAQVRFEVKVSDTAGQEQTTSATRIVTSQPLKLEIIPEQPTLIPGVANRVYVLTSYADGRPARTRVFVSDVERELKTSDLGVAAFDFTPTLEESQITVEVTDDQGRMANQTIDFELGKSRWDFIVRTDKAVYRGGETVKLAALGSGREPVFVDLVKGGQTILTETVTMSDGRGDYAFDLPPEVSGTIVLSAYRFDANGFAVRKARTIYVHEARDLRLNVTSDRAEYRPGGEAKVNFVLRDRDGKASPGAVSVAVVDEAVFSVLNQRPGMEQTFFNLDEELLKPIYAIYPWSPDLTTSVNDAGRIDLEQALFSRTYQTPKDQRDVLRDLVEKDYIQKELLNVLDRPDLEQLLENSSMSEEMKNTLRNTSGTTLDASSYPVKVQQVQHRREKWRRSSEEMFCFVLGFAIIVGIVLIIVFAGNRVLDALVILAALVLLAAIMLPSLGRARSSAMRSAALSSLRQIETAMMEASAEGEASMEDRKAGAGGENVTPVRIRQWFPETLFWRPEVITDEQGFASVTIPLADSITTWRLSAGAVSGDGRLGGAQAGIKVFQPFFVDLNLPVALTRGDEAAVPIVVYNYLDREQTVDLTIERGGWFEGLDASRRQIKLGPGEIKSTSYRLRVTKVGNQEFQVTARGQDFADAIKRRIDVVPDGKRVEQVFSGILSQPREIALRVPANAIDGSVKAILKIYPSSFSQVVEGLDAIFQQPYGCFEQTSSTTYPNVLALDYLRRAGKSVPEVEAKARQYIHLGYQRLLGFEVSGGGFDWFGRPPANRVLTAYGLMEFEDMAKVHDVDPSLIERTRRWLMRERNGDGSWSPEGETMHSDAGNLSNRLDTLSTTAYIAWSVFGGKNGLEAEVTREYLLSHQPAAIGDPYVLALVCNALLAMDGPRSAVEPYLDRLTAMSKRTKDDKRVWWSMADDSRTTFYGSGRSGEVEATALAALAMIRADHHPGMVRGALSWLIEQKDSSGMWHSTQATVLALKALLAGTSKALGGDRERRVEATIKKFSRQITIPADQSEVVRQTDLTAELTAGENVLKLTDRSGADSTYQVIFRYHEPNGPALDVSEPLSIRVAYDRSTLTVNDVVKATATAVNNTTSVQPMVILDLPIPSGFAAMTEDFTRLVSLGQVAKFQLTPRSVIVYLRQIAPGEPLTLTYRLRATMPVKITVHPAAAYEYYNPDRRGTSESARLEVREKL